MKKIIIPITILFFSIALPAQAQEASLFLSPGSRSFMVEDTFSVEVKVDTAGIPINAAQTIIYFPSDKLELLNISKENSIFTLWPEEPIFSNLAGEISFSGGTPHPGFNRTGNLITLNFKAKKEGIVNLTLGEGKVLADDGKGTNILVFIKEAKYFIQEARVLPEAELPQIICLTHPQEEWYNNNNPHFQWEIGPAITGVSFILDRNPNTIPDTDSEGKIQSKIYENINDGVWYFHLRLENEAGWSEPAHQKIQIDTSPPYPFEIIIDNAGDSTNPQPNLYFETNDDTSGINYYKFKFGEGEFLNLMLAQINPFSLPSQQPGNYPIIVRAVDRAGNNVETKTVLDVKPIESPQLILWPQTYISGEETFYIEGTALPEVEITIFLKKNEKIIKKWQTLSNNQGEWSFSTKELIKSGIYSLSTQAEDQRGAVSEVTQPETIEISLRGLALGPILVTFRMSALIFALFSVLGILAFGFLIFQIRQSKKTLKKETKEAKESLHNNFAILRREIEKRIELLDSQPGFNPEERKICEDLNKALKNSEETIGKEIKDIEKELE